MKGDEDEVEYVHDEYMDKDPSPYDGDYSEC
jgi:hypothetical protein